YYVTEDITIVEGEDYMGWTEEGTYQRDLISSAGCDSVVVTYLSIEQVNVESVHTIYLEKGWNIISSYLMPSESNMESVMESLRNDGYLVKVEDESSNTYEQKNRNFPWVNNIGNFQETEGYRIQVRSNCALEIKGSQISLPLSIPLKGGTNIISFPVNESVDAIQVIQPLIDAGVLNKVQDEKGNSIEKWRNKGWVNGIGNFEAGEGYIVQVSSDAILTINESYTKSAQVLAENSAPTYFQVDYEGNGIDHMNINVVELAGSGLKVGDEIAVFDNGICVGALKLTGHNLTMDAISIPASAKEEGMNNGYLEGHQIEIRVWSQEMDEEVIVSAEIVEGEIVEGELVYSKLASVFTTLGKDVNVNAGEQMDFDSGVEVYPNPAQNYVNIRFSSMPDTDTKILLFDISGRQMLALEAQSNLEVINLDELSSGIYLIKTGVKNRMETHKLIKR
ncbi:MAG: T9SS type A sorting domain-containing protein, partial [Bacteroidota bacterium]